MCLKRAGVGVSLCGAAIEVYRLLGVDSLGMSSSFRRGGFDAGIGQWFAVGRSGEGDGRCAEFEAVLRALAHGDARLPFVCPDRNGTMARTRACCGFLSPTLVALAVG